MVGINIRLRLENFIVDAHQQDILGNYFDTLRRQDDANNPCAMLHRIQAFLTTSPPMFGQLERQLVDFDFDASRATLQRITDDCVNVGGGRVIPRFLQLARILESRDHPLCLALLSVVKDEYTLLVAALAQIAAMEEELAEHHISRREWRQRMQRQRRRND